jgi:hypothetical protein
MIVALGGNDLLRGIDPASRARTSTASCRRRRRGTSRCCWSGCRRRAITGRSTRRPSTRSIPISRRNTARSILDSFFAHRRRHQRLRHRPRCGRARAVGHALAEKGDLAPATSSASTKLFHGGLRYLEYFEFRLVREALRERETLLRAMPHIAGRCASCCRSPDMRFDSDTPVALLARGPCPG